MQVSQKLAITRHIKKELKSLGDSPPLIFLESLPACPQQLAQQQPSLYNSVFQKHPPVPLKIEMQLFAEVLATVRCRGPKAGASCSALDTTNFTQVAGQVMAQMQAMQQMQMATLQALSGRGGRAPLVMQEGALALGAPALALSARATVVPALPPVPVGEAELAKPETSEQQQQHQQTQQGQEQQQHEQPEQQQELLAGSAPANDSSPAPASKRARLSVSDSVALISHKLAERNAAQKEGSKPKKTKPQKSISGKKGADRQVGGKGSGSTAPAPRPHYTIERTRKQVVCRTGLKGSGQYHCIAFGTQGEKAAVRKAQAWVLEQKKALKL